MFTLLNINFVYKRRAVKVQAKSRAKPRYNKSRFKIMPFCEVVHGFNRTFFRVENVPLNGLKNAWKFLNKIPKDSKH